MSQKKPTLNQFMQSPKAWPALPAIVLAAGRAQRMGANKLLARFAGEYLIQRVVRRLHEAAVQPIVVVTGHEAERIHAALAAEPIQWAHNPNYAQGLASSLKVGIQALPEDALGVLVMLGDMPEIDVNHLNALAEEFFRHQGQCVVQPITAGQGGNPCILPKALFPAVQQLTGDVGAKALFAHATIPIVQVVMGTEVLVDVDTPTALHEAGGYLK